jgi:hypothetical protein
MAVNMRRDRQSHPPSFPAFNEPEEDAKLSHHPTFGEPDDEPEGPDIPETGETKPAEAHVNDLESRLFKGRKVMVFGQITDKLARDRRGPGTGARRRIREVDPDLCQFARRVMSSRVTRDP